MKRAALVILPVFAFSALGEEEPAATEGAGKAAVQVEDSFKVFPDPAGKEYFPKDRASYYTKYLLAMKEPSVQTPPEKGVDRVFRFTYLRSFHDPLVVRISEAGEAVTVRAVRLQMNQQYQPVKIVHDKTWKLDEESRKAVKTLPEQEDFWAALSDAEQSVAQGMMDGSTWVFEVHDKDGYRMIDIRSPDALAKLELGILGKDSSKPRDYLAYKKTGEKLLKIGGILPEPEERY
jgi:hypothetical protein